jgi:sulfur relay (sulfurtransferase) complex TusBCD TusD component (DsrE family)
MAKTLSMILWTAPYGSQNTSTALKVAKAAAQKGYLVRLFASGDGVHNFTKDQKASGIPNAEKEFLELMQAGLKVELCGTCLNFRGIKNEDIVAGAERSTMKNLFTMVKESDVFITFWE